MPFEKRRHMKEENMARFCSQCGKPLQEGEVCTCQQAAGGNPAVNQEGAVPQGQPSEYSQAAPQGQPGGFGQGPQGQPGGYSQGPQGQPGGYGQVPPQGQPYGYGQVPPQGQPYGYGQAPYGAPQQPGAAGIYMKGLWGTILDAYKKPAETLSSLAESAKVPVIMGICGIQTLLFSLIFMFLGFRVNGAMGGFKVANTPLMFVMALIAGAGVLAAYGAFALAFTKGVAKKNMTYMQGLGVAAAKALAQMPFTAVTALFVLIMPINEGSGIMLIITFLIYCAGNLLAYTFIPAAMERFGADDKNRKVWQIFLTLVVSIVASYIIAWLYGKIIGNDIASLFGRLM